MHFDNVFWIIMGAVILFWFLFLVLILPRIARTAVSTETKVRGDTGEEAKQETGDPAVHPQRIGVIVLKDRLNIDLEATASIRDLHVIELVRVQDAYAFRPVLELVHNGGNQGGVFVVVQFGYYKDGQWQLGCIQHLPWQKEMIFYPSVVLDLSAYHTTKTKLLGLWEVQVGYATISAQTLTGIDAQQQRETLLGLEFAQLTKFSWQIVKQQSKVALTETGERRSPRSTSLEVAVQKHVDLEQI